MADGSGTPSSTASSPPLTGRSTGSAPGSGGPAGPGAAPSPILAPSPTPTQGAVTTRSTSSSGGRTASSSAAADDDVFCGFLFSGNGGAAGSPVTLSALGDQEIKRGYLVKQGGVIRNWKRRLFVLTGNELRYFTSPEATTPKGVIPTNSVRKIRSKGPCAFVLQTETRDWALVAESERAKKEWMTAIYRTQYQPSRLAALLKEAQELEQRGVITADEKQSIKLSLLSGDSTEVAQAEQRLAGLKHREAEPSELELILEQFESVTRDIGLLNVLDRLKAVLTKDAVPPSVAERIRSIASKQLAQPDNRWTAAVQDKFALTMAALRIASEPDVASHLTVESDPSVGSGDKGSPSARGSSVNTDTSRFERKSDGRGRLKPEPSLMLEETVVTESAEFDQDYDLGPKLGEGGYSVVYEGIHRRTREKVAVKVVQKNRLSAKETAGLQEEVRVMKRLRHPHIVRLIAFYDEPTRYCIVTELMTGGELFDQIVKKTHYTEEEARKIIATMASAIQYCHARGIVHRDLKPENILLSSTDESEAVIKIADMGFARPIRPEGMSTSCGTPSYVAPDILRGERYGAAVDMWSLGVVAYILLCGYAPFSSSNQAKLFRQICKGQYKFNSPYWDGISADAKDLIAHLLVVDPEKRFTADQVLAHTWIAQEAVLSGANLGGVVAALRQFNQDRRRVVKQGFLVKQGHFVKSWKRRAFVLTGEELRYFESDTSTQPLGVIPLNEIEDVVDIKGTPSFQITTASGKDYTIQAANDEEKREWMRVVMSTQQHRDLVTKAHRAIRAQQVEEAAGLLSLAEEFASTSLPDSPVPSSSWGGRTNTRSYSPDSPRPPSPASVDEMMM